MKASVSLVFGTEEGSGVASGSGDISGSGMLAGSTSFLSGVVSSIVDCDSASGGSNSDPADDGRVDLDP
jgi:hypothetical protein